MGTSNLEELNHSLLVEEVKSQPEHSHIPVDEALGDGEQPLVPNSVMPEIDGLEGGVDGQSLAERLGPVVADLVIEDVELPQGGVLLQRLGDHLASRHADLVLADVKRGNELVDLKNLGDYLGALLEELIISQIQDLYRREELVPCGVQGEEQQVGILPLDLAFLEVQNLDVLIMLEHLGEEGVLWLVLLLK